MSSDLIIKAAVERAMTHTTAATSLLRTLYAEAIATELEQLAAFGERVTADLLRQRADYLRDGISRERLRLLEDSDPRVR